eukprot:TRINITY_DN4552_c0_g2_i1.p2 TRINITY_DN4552_c0_g2~~TRINITY_DN4552_c0_g2_i1.p2  ORF type:complete len:304 (-),score=-33.33 TRINITY_DN4552_c0_g2_i1:334-1245(-)
MITYAKLITKQCYVKLQRVQCKCVIFLYVSQFPATVISIHGRRQMEVRGVQAFLNFLSYQKASMKSEIYFPIFGQIAHSMVRQKAYFTRNSNMNKHNSHRYITSFITVPIQIIYLHQIPPHPTPPYPTPPHSPHPSIPLQVLLKQNIHFLKLTTQIKLLEIILKNKTESNQKYAVNYRLNICQKLNFSQEVTGLVVPFNLCNLTLHVNAAKFQFTAKLLNSIQKKGKKQILLFLFLYHNLQQLKYPNSIISYQGIFFSRILCKIPKFSFLVQIRTWTNRLIIVTNNLRLIYFFIAKKTFISIF